MHRPTPPSGPLEPDDLPPSDPPCWHGGLVLGVVLLVLAAESRVGPGPTLEQVAAALVIVDVLRGRRT